MESLSIIFSLILSSLIVYTSAVRVTVDDANTTFWSFTHEWVAISTQTPCQNCTSRPDTSKVFDQTWHDGSGPRVPPDSAQLTFTGVSFEIYAICTNDYGINASFILDGAPDGQFLGPQPYAPTLHTTT